MGADPATYAFAGLGGLAGGATKGATLGARLGKIGEGAAGQNSGFMINIPHNNNAKGDYHSSIKKDKDTISLHREAIEFASQMVEEYDVPPNVFNKIGKLNGAATAKGISFNQDYKKQLDSKWILRST